MKTFKNYLLATVLFLMGVASAGTISREYNREIDFVSGGDVSVRLPNGNLYVRTWDENRVDVHADITIHSSSKKEAERFLQEMEIVIKRHGDRLDIFVEKPKTDGFDVFDWFFGNRRVRSSINIDIKLPTITNVELKSINGSIEISELKGRARLKTTNGKINANRMYGELDAESTNGSIRAEMDIPELRENVRLSTVNGSLHLTVPESIAADVDISTVNGSIRSDFPLTVEGKWGPKHVDEEINGGGYSLTLNSVNGSVTLNTR
ncbi:MAG: DUF4097 family beta strand repeat-containing protein [candidate division KSB1 bacterium]|nr:DUF4097 family beta strand repeat-containing protein [candidate division KSB1 bacterium]